MSNSVLLAHSGTAEIRSTVLPNTVLVHYNYEFGTLNHIRDKLLQSTSRAPVKHWGLHLQLTENSQLSLSGVEKMIISKYSLQKETAVRQFFRTFISDRCPIEGVFIDIFLTAPIPDEEEIECILKNITRKKITVRFIHRFISEDAISSNRKILQIYFNVDKLIRLKTTNSNATTIQVKSKLPSATSRYERIRVAGKGAFGMAVLYRRKEDDSLVIIKEIRIHELSSNERQLALNEVTLLSQLDHPSIISYFDSFEEDGVLMIEMEYAEGGTLAQLLTRVENYIEEGEIMRLFDQITNAVAYLHDNSVLHRDLKTANIFLTKYNDVKVGDFGISKIMSAETVVQGAHTVVGTPFYISPEMCEGKPYNEKSDIWALGCILYEMACLQKTFDGANLPAVVNKIMKAEYNQVKGPYSNKLKILIRQMLKTDAKERPTAKELLEFIHKGRKISYSGSKDSDARFANSRSSLYHLDIANMVLVPEPSLPPKIKVKQIEFSVTHTLVLSADNMVYSWGENKCGQLGLGDRRSRGSPTIIEALSGKGISKIAAGNQFSLFCSTKGVVLVCGQQKYLGNGEKGEDCLKPKVVDSLLRVDITDVACGDEHTVAIDSQGNVYVWGSGKNGRLGTGDENFVTTAIQITIPVGQTIMNVRCGHDCTALLTTSGIMLAMGSNKYNKLNLNHRQGFFADMKDVTDDVDDVTTPRAMKPFAARIVDVKLGTFHSGVLLESGHIHLFGRNAVGELGMGHRQRYAPWNIYNPVKALLNKTCLLLACGDGFSLAATSDNKLFFWGSKSTEQNDVSVEDLENSYGTFDDKKTLIPSRLQTRRFNWTKSSSFENTESMPTGSIMLQPTLILRLDSTPDAEGSRALIRLSSLGCIGKNVIVVIDTVAPTKKIEQPTRKPERRRSAPASTSTDNTVVEPWIQQELAEADNWAYSRHKPNASTEQKLLQEIEELKKKLSNHESTCKTHAVEMNQLQAKIAHLNRVQQEMAIQSVPPPAYDSQTKQEVTKGIKNNMKNIMSGRSWLSGVVGSIVHQESGESSTPVHGASRKRKVKAEDDLDRSVLTESVKASAEKYKRSKVLSSPTSQLSGSILDRSDLNTSLSSKTREIFDKMSGMSSILAMRRGPKTHKTPIKEITIDDIVKTVEKSPLGEVVDKKSYTFKKEEPEAKRTSKIGSIFGRIKAAPYRKLETNGAVSKTPEKKLEELKEKNGHLSLPSRPAMQPFMATPERKEESAAPSVNHSAKQDQTCSQVEASMQVQNIIKDIDVNNLDFSFSSPIVRGPRSDDNFEFAAPLERGPMNSISNEEADVNAAVAPEKGIEATSAGGKWRCKACSVQNSASSKECSCCGNSKASEPCQELNSKSVEEERAKPVATEQKTPSNGVALFSLGDRKNLQSTSTNKPTPTATTKWSCTECFVSNESSSSKCACCGHVKSGSAPAAPTSTSAATKWACSECFVANESCSDKCACCGHAKPGSTPVAPASTSAATKWACSECFVSNESFSDKCACCGHAKPGSAPVAPASTSAFGSKAFKPTANANVSLKFGFGNAPSTEPAVPVEKANSFGAPVPTGLFNTATSESSATKPSNAFSFGASTNAPAAGSAFGSNSSSISSGLAFGAKPSVPAPAPAAGAGPAFEATTAAQPLAFGSSSALNFGTTNSQPTPPSGLFNTSTEPVPSAASAPPSGLFTFAASNASSTQTAAPAASSGGFNFGASTTSFAFGAANTQTNPPSFGIASAPAPNSNDFNLGAAQLNSKSVEEERAKPVATEKKTPSNGVALFSLGDSKNLQSTSTSKPTPTATTQWSCSECFVSNESSSSKCACCGHVKSGSAPAAPTSTSATTKWACSECFVANESCSEKCACCGHAKPGSTPVAPASTSAFGSKAFKPTANANVSLKFGFGNAPSAEPAVPVEKTNSFGAPAPTGLFNTATSESSATKPSNAFSFGASTNAPAAGFAFGSNSSSISSGLAFGAKPSVPAPAPTTAAQPLAFGSSSTLNFGTTNSQPAPPSGLFNTATAPVPSAASAPPSGLFTFGASNASSTQSAAPAASSGGFNFGASTTSFAFGAANTQTNPPSFGIASAPAPNNNGFNFGAAPTAPTQAGFNFSANLPSSFNFGGGNAEPSNNLVQFGAPAAGAPAPAARRIAQARRRRR
ncbi:hypothetical protein QR680_008488 [Steinernema hermaphroditum]|uniref:non-specific serine/threonine protein kinase n=1 Tax=Steinernema hermaphroditum TaxID=289476 RepID=A0AA39IIZ8_9BILA|nr:hypothetical protein QR680_008488 [Steinernema hermaphroditum]